MSQLTNEVAGELEPDGTLVFDHLPDVKPGRVIATLRSETSVPRPSSLECFESLQRLLVQMRRENSRKATTEEIEARIAWNREGDWLDEWLANDSAEPPPC